MKAVVFAVVFLFSLGATAQGGTPLPAKNSASILFAVILALALPGIRLLARGERSAASRESTGSGDERPVPGEKRD